MATQLVLFPALERERCLKCSGTGEYVFGAIVNGVPSKRGMCFQCRGKGFTTPADRSRTAFYFDHIYAVRAN